jgi:hypothetical protein
MSQPSVARIVNNSDTLQRDAEGHPRPAQAHRPALQKGLMKAASDLTGSVGELTRTLQEHY